jgi:hypothetical protein
MQRNRIEIDDCNSYAFDAERACDGSTETGRAADYDGRYRGVEYHSSFTFGSLKPSPAR